MQPFIFKTLKIASIALLLLCHSSCKEVFEEDLSGKSISIIIPANNTVTPNRNVHFKWKEVEGATSYKLEIVSPSFSNIQFFEVDSSVSTNEIFINLVPNDYEWRVRAVNNSSNTDFTLPYKLKIDTTSNLTSQVVVLTSPSNNEVTNSMSFIFGWNDIDIADNYDFILKNGNDWNTATITSSHYDITTNSATVNGIPEGEYIWGVRAKNTIPSITNYSLRNLFIDTTHPVTPILSLPANNASFPDTDTISFKWGNPADVGAYKSSVHSVVELYSDSLITLFDTLHSSSASKLHRIPTTGTYFWRMYTEDQATNTSFYSAARKLIIF